MTSRINFDSSKNNTNLSAHAPASFNYYKDVKTPQRSRGVRNKRAGAGTIRTVPLFVSPTLERTKLLILAAVRLWELKNGIRN
ncbi:MAG: hypothetical protein ACR2G0_09890 [Chthoniobacterales bacterium]